MRSRKIPLKTIVENIHHSVEIRKKLPFSMPAKMTTFPAIMAAARVRAGVRGAGAGAALATG